VIDWARTSPIIANMYNPAYLGELIRRVAEAYRKECACDLPLMLAFLALPLVLYPDSRATLRARIRLAIAFAVAHRALMIEEGGGLRPRRRPRGASVPRLESSDTFSSCQTIGRWLARAELESNIFIMLGVGL
jgi:hypothetical protein